MRAGKVSGLRVDRKTKRALVDFELTKQGFGDLRADTYCESRPQSLIGEYFIDCIPGKSPEKLEAGRDDPRRADRLDDPRRPARQRHAPPLPRAPADHPQRARRRRRRPRRGRQRDDPPRQPRAARDRQGAEDPRPPEPGPQGPDHQRGHGHRRPRGQPPQRRALRQGDRGRRDHLGGAPARARRGPAAAADLPARAASPRWPSSARPRTPRRRTCATSTPPPASSSASSRTSARSRSPAASTCARSPRPPTSAGPRSAPRSPTVAELTKTTEKAPELANNLEIVLRDLDDRGRAVETDKRSPGGKGYTGFEAVLSYIFDQMMAINVFDENGYILKINLSASECSEYQNADSLRRKEKESPGFIKRCLAGARPQPARRHDAPTRPTPASTIRATSRQAPGAKSSKKKSKRQAARASRRRRARTRPASPTSRRRSSGCSAAAAATTSPPCPRPRCRTSPRSPPSRSCRRCPPCRTSSQAAAAGQSADPQALLDYLLSP